MQKLIRELGLSLDGNPIYYRTNTDDLEFFSDVLVKKQYGCAGLDFGDPEVIVDCGAYVGYTSLYYLTTYKNARIIAIEPDKSNFELCGLNLAPYAGRVTLVNAAVWPESVPLVVREGPTSASEWATIVRPCAGDEAPDVMGMELITIIRDAGFGHIDLLNMNTGLEQAIFSRNFTAWLDVTRNFVGRLADRGAEDAFYAAMSEYRFFLTRCQAVLACTSIAPKAPARPAQSRDGRFSGSLITNSDFEELRVESAQSIPGGWIEGSRDPAFAWQLVVCASQFHASLAVRTGLQRSGQNALYVGMNPGQPIPPSSAPYAAVENQTRVPVSEGESWLIGAFIKAVGSPSPADLLRGAYVFLRVYYDDGSSKDVQAPRVSHITGDYTEVVGTVTIPSSLSGRLIERATLWLYVWVENMGPDELHISADLPWGVFFDNVICTKL